MREALEKVMTQLPAEYSTQQRCRADQVAADLLPFGEPVKRLAAQVVLNDLPLELDRVVAVLGRGFLLEGPAGIA